MGQIVFNKVKLRYRVDTDLILKELSFKIEAGQKIGIVGRTGAGKSTLCLALSRIIEVTQGSIEIDGFDIKQVSLDLLR
jgi:ATP-binding cassette subfamily C (CFTR/MRP) protein 1